MALSTIYKAPAQKIDPNSGQYRDIFNYMEGGNYSPEERAFGLSTIGDNAQHVFQDPNKINTWQAPDQFRDVIKTEDFTGYGDEGKGAGKRFNIDYSKLPNGGMTKYGSVADVIPIRSQYDLNKLKNKGMVYYDPNYGLITHRSNKKDSTLDKVTAGVVQAAAGGMLGAGLGAVGGGMLGGALSPSVASGLGNMGVGSLTSGKAPGLGSLTSLAGSYFGLPSWARGLASYGVNAATNRGQGG
jgi:hypothetical protein